MNVIVAVDGGVGGCGGCWGGFSGKDSKKPRENQFPFSFCGKRCKRRGERQMSDWSAGQRTKHRQDRPRKTPLLPCFPCFPSSSFHFHFPSWFKCRSRRKDKWKGLSHDQEMRLKFEHWGERQKTFCGNRHVGQRGRGGPEWSGVVGPCLIWMKWQHC